MKKVAKCDPVGFRQKILGLAVLSKEIQEQKKLGKKIVHCHGVFDLLHPGHLKHFEEAKTLGDFLVVTVTADRFVNKGPGRPVFSENLRAEALAALSLIDYVAINETPTAVEPIALIQPDFYVKGQDYEAREKDQTGGILKEEAAVLAVGGKIHFTHGITFSSTQLLKTYFLPKEKAFTRDELLELFYEMLRIRRVEEAIALAYPNNEMRCPIHLSIGQEATPVAVSRLLNPSDHVFSTHRCHAHYLAKGGNLNQMIAELYGKITGCSKGKGGSMHLVDTKVGMMGASALVGGTIPIATGSALAFQREKSNRVSVAYLGDGATEEGVFYESLNFASLHKLPILYVVENNFYATYSSQKARQATLEIFKRGESVGVPGYRVDGNDVKAVLKAAAPLVQQAREGGGPALLECVTYRLKDHVGPGSDLNIGYRSQEEWSDWFEKCPLKKLKTELALSEEENSTLETKIQRQIETAFEFAKTSPFPSALKMERSVYAPAELR